MEDKKIKLYILHAGLGHKSPYFYNLCNKLNKHEELDVIVKPELPLGEKTTNGIIYFNRLKRYYDSNDLESIDIFLNNVDKLKENGWKIIFTLHNFFPIDRTINENDELLLRKFLPKVDKVFTFTDYMKNSLKNYFNVDAITHSIGMNTLDDEAFDNKIELKKFSSDDFIFTFIGNVSEYKMLDKVIENFEKLNDKHAYLIIAGPTGRNYNLTYKENPNIIRIDKFIGDKGWQELSKITNIFINTYDVNRECFKYGFFSSNCIQLINVKKICIVPECEVIKEILPSHFYYTYKDNDDLLNTMKKSIIEKEKIKKLEKKYPKINYSWEKMVNIIIEQIKEI